MNTTILVTIFATIFNLIENMISIIANNIRTKGSNLNIVHQLQIIMYKYNFIKVYTNIFINILQLDLLVFDLLAAITSFKATCSLNVFS